MLAALKQIQDSLRFMRDRDPNKLKNPIPLEKDSLTQRNTGSDAEINETLEIIQHNLLLSTYSFEDMINHPAKDLPSYSIEPLNEFKKEIQAALDFSARYAERTVGYGTFPTLRHPLAQHLLTQASKLQRIFLEFQAEIHDHAPSGLHKPSK